MNCLLSNNVILYNYLNYIAMFNNVYQCIILDRNVYISSSSSWKKKDCKNISSEYMCQAVRIMYF